MAQGNSAVALVADGRRRESWPRPVVRENQLRAVVGELKERAAIEIEGFDNAALRILDGAIDEVRVEVDELGRQIRDECLESQPILERRAKRIVSLRHDR